MVDCHPNPTYFPAHSSTVVPLAQLVEQLTFNQRVEGSNPSGHTTFLLHIKRSVASPFAGGV